MDLLTREDLNLLIETEGEWCVSIYMPTVRAGTEAQQNPIRFRNLLRTAEERLGELGARVPDIEALLAPAYDLLDDADFWRHGGDGLAVFVAKDFSRSFRLPVSFGEMVTARNRFAIKPLMELLSGDGRFYVLALSQDQVRLLEGTRDSVSEVELDGVPASLAEALKYDDPESRLQLRALAPGSVGGPGGALVHGHGAGTDTVAKLNLLRYFQMVDRGLRDLLADKNIPLVLAGVDYLLPIYREANTYGHVLDDGLTGNPDLLSAKELHRRAWEIVRPYYARGQAEQVAQYHELAGRADGRATNNLKEIVQAAHTGRVATLFVARGVQQWGVYRAHSHNVHVHPDEQPGDQDLLDLAAARTFANGGAVFVMDRQEVPGGQPWAAILRY